MVLICLGGFEGSGTANDLVGELGVMLPVLGVLVVVVELLNDLGVV
jgi:hypothetical protein